MILFDSPGLLVTYDAKNTMVCFEVKEFVEGDEFRRPLEAALTFLSMRKIARIFWDLRLMKVLNPADQEWSEKDWIPRLVKATQVRRSAVLVPKSVLAQMSINRITDRAAAVMENELVTQFFDSREAAESWLRGVG